MKQNRLKFYSSSRLRSARLNRLSLAIMGLGIAALVAAAVLFGLSATGIIGDGGLRYSGPGTVTGFGSVVQTPVWVTPSPLPPEVPTPSEAPITRLVIPEAGVDAPVVTLGIDGNGAMESPSNAYDVAWYDFSARPGFGSNAVFSGHVDYHDVGPAVFWELRNLEKDDVIEIRLQDGTAYIYHVTALECLPVNEAPIAEIVGPTPSEVITLITCCGEFNYTTRQYSHRLVVRADRPIVLPPS
jgi:LPXTG-site transpeptidase (sortase) family protein